MKNTKLSVNLNKIALLRNARGGSLPSVSYFAELALQSGADGITVHPRPDLRHIRPKDVRDLSTLDCELNIEGNPFLESNANYPGFVELVLEAAPFQCTLVPDLRDQLTSDHGWDISGDAKRLEPVICRLRDAGCRVSLFVDPACPDLALAADLGAHCVELYTQDYATNFGSSSGGSTLARYARTAQEAHSCGLQVNAGHDLNRENLAQFLTIGHIAEVSIGQAIVVDAVEHGFCATVQAYKRIIAQS